MKFFRHPISVLIFVIAVGVEIGVSFVGWKHNILEGHEFRQAQVAMTIRFLERDGWSLAYPLPVFGPPWSAPLEFPLFQYIVAAVHPLTSGSIESASRAVSLGFFLLSLPALYLSLGFLGMIDRRRWLVLALIVVSPIYLYYSRTVMIESTALCLAAWFLYTFGRALETRRGIWIAAALVIGILAVLAKATTFAVFLVPAVWLTLNRMRQARKATPSRWTEAAHVGVLALAIAGIALAAGFAWVWYSDVIKGSNPLSAFLQSEHMAIWMYGPWSQRIDPKVWRSLIGTVDVDVMNRWVLLTALVLAVAAGHASRIRGLGLLACYLAGPLLFTNLYFVHDYYHYAAAGFLIALVAVGWFAGCDRLKLPAPVEYLGVTGLLVAQVWTFGHTYYRLQSAPVVPPPELSRLLQTATEPDDVLLMYGYEWNAIVPYFADRKAVMVLRENYPNTAGQAQVLGALRGRIGAVVFHDDTISNKPLITWVHGAVDLDLRPVLSDGDTRVYFPRRNIAAAGSRLKLSKPVGLTLDLPPDGEFNGLKLWRHTPAELPDRSIESIFSPLPTAILTPWGIATTNVGGRVALNAHAPTELEFALPPNARRVHAEFGIAPAAYEGAKKTDGVEFRIDLKAPGQAPVTLLSQLLTPADKPGDRGTQQVDLELPAGATGQLVLRTLPGLTNDMSFDWAYWAAVRIR